MITTRFPASPYLSIRNVFHVRARLEVKLLLSALVARLLLVFLFFFVMFALKTDTGKSHELRRKIIAIIVQIVVRTAHF